MARAVRGQDAREADSGHRPGPGQAGAAGAIRGTPAADLRRVPMSDTKLGFRNVRTGKVVEVEMRPDHSSVIPPEVAADARDWMPGVIGPTGRFHASDLSVSFVVKFPDET